MGFRNVGDNLVSLCTPRKSEPLDEERQRNGEKQSFFVHLGNTGGYEQGEYSPARIRAPPPVARSGVNPSLAASGVVNQVAS